MMRYEDRQGHTFDSQLMNETNKFSIVKKNIYSVYDLYTPFRIDVKEIE